ncbi:MAG: TSUP family transporter, partial [Oscillospiraceae bacterium]
MNIIYFLIAMLASAIGAISGIGGGVILKPVLDSLGTFSVPVITFMSGCTVLSMSAMSVLTGRKSSAAVNAKITVFLAIGSCLGGIAGKNVFHLVEQIFADSDTIGMIQAIVLLVINLSVFIFTLNKRRINTFHVSNRFVCVAIGFFLGILSAFLGIGGGPINIAVLFI